MAGVNVDITTIHSYLMVDEAGSGSWTKLCDIRSFPEIGGSPNEIDTTTMSDEEETAVAGIRKRPSASTFDARFTIDMWKKIKGYGDTTKDFAIWFGANAQKEPDGHFCKFKGKGTANVSLKSGAIDAIVEASVALTMSTPFELDETTGGGTSGT